MREYTASWRLREAIKTHVPERALTAYRQWLTPRLTEHKDYVRFSRWAAAGRLLRNELGTPRVSFDADGIWVCDADGLEWCYEPDSWLSALGKELGWAHEQAELEYVTSALRTGGCYLDLGAHVGGYAIPIARNVPEIGIHLFEPVPATRRLLEKNAARNGVIDRLRIWPYAVGDTARTAEMSIADGVANRLADHGPAGPGAVAVDVVRVDDVLFDEVPRVDVVKCDIEGAELPALRGAERILRRDHPDLMLEIDRRFTPRFGYQPYELVVWLAEMGYRWERFVDDRRLPAIELERALAEGNNFLFTAR